MILFPQKTMRGLNNLVEQGILYKKRGKGTFVSQHKIGFFPNLLSFIEIIKKKGLHPSSIVLSQEVILADKFLSEILNLKEKSEIIFTKTLR